MRFIRSNKFILAGFITFFLLLSAWAFWKMNLSNVEIVSLRSLGWPLWFGCLVLMVIAGGLGLPPVLLIIPAATIWEFPMAFMLCLFGGLGASVLGFLLSRYALQEWVEPRIPLKIVKFEHRLETHAFSTVLVMRLLFYLFPPLNWMLGISHIPLVTFVLATLVGMLPATFIYVWAGQGLLGFILSLSLIQSVSLLLPTLVALGVWLRWVLKTG